MFPTPKYRRSKNIVMAEEVKSPLLVFTNSKQKPKNKNKKTTKKKTGTVQAEFGSVK
jgi:hypothetical protein